MLQSVSKQSFKAFGAIYGIYALLILVSLAHFAMEICNSGLLVQHTSARPRTGNVDT